MNDKIEIKLSKTKLFLLLLGAIVFFVLGVLFVVKPEQFVVGLLKNREFVRIVGIVTTAFSVFCLIFIVKKLFDSKTGLIIDQNGITDNSNATSIGLIKWEDITGVKTVQIASTKVLILETNKPEAYIERAKNRFSRQVMKNNYKMYGTPLSITSNALNIKYKELERLIVKELEERKP